MTQPVARHVPGPRERVVAIVCAAAIILYLVLAYLVFVRPGVSRTGHLLVVLLPTGMLALSAEVWPSLRAGLRASLALMYGAIAFVTGLAAVSRVPDEGATPAGLCGLLPLVAGAVLIGLGVWLLWISRVRTDPLWMTVARRGLLVVAALLLVVWVVLPVSTAIVATDRPRKPVDGADLGRPQTPVTLTARDGLQLAASYVPTVNGATVITFPREATIPQARMLVDAGYGVLLVDPRGYGDSQGNPDTYGWGSIKDVDAAVAWLRRRPEVRRQRVGGLGVGMGGEQMLAAASRNRGLKAVVSDGAGIRSVLEMPALDRLGAFEKVILYPRELVLTVSLWLLGGEPIPPALQDAVPFVAPRPLLFIYGQDAGGIERAANPAYYSAARSPKAVWEVPGADHAQGMQAQPALYERQMLGFFERSLRGPR